MIVTGYTKCLLVSHIFDQRFAKRGLGGYLLSFPVNQDHRVFIKIIFVLVELEFTISAKAVPSNYATLALPTPIKCSTGPRGKRQLNVVLYDNDTV